MADRLVIINNGRIVGNGTLRDLQQKTQRYERALVAVAVPREEAEQALRALAQVTRVRFLRAIDGFTSFEVQATHGAHVRRHIGELAVARNWQVGELRLQPPTLEEVFLALTEPQTHAADAGA